MGEITQAVFNVTLAALMHDIGKPFQREVKSDRETLCSESLQMKDLVRRGDHSYAHCLWTSDFINRHMQEIMEKFEIRSGSFDALASCHHNPAGNEILQQIITEADRASAGMDRERFLNKQDDSDIQENNRNIEYYERPMDSLFSRIRIKETGGTYSRMHNLGKICDPDAIFPKEKSFKLKPEDYEKLNKEFSDDFARLDDSSKSRFLEALTGLINRYYWSVPSSTMEEYADIPLADHLTTTAAIAAALTRSCEELKDDFNVKDSRFLWVSGDFSGIQKFIFSLSGELSINLAKLLRGRSFIVSLFTVLAARMLTDACGLPPLNALSTAGGNSRFCFLIHLGYEKPFLMSEKK